MGSRSMSTSSFLERGALFKPLKLAQSVAFATITFTAYWLAQPIYAEAKDESPLKPTAIVATVIPSQPSHYKSACNTQKVPDVNGLSIQQARKAMFRDGWRPVRNTEPLWSNRELNFLNNGIHEVVFCSGTGMAQCYFEYQRNDDKVRLITFGEYDESVGDIEAYCPELE